MLKYYNVNKRECYMHWESSFLLLVVQSISTSHPSVLDQQPANQSNRQTNN